MEEVKEIQKSQGKAKSTEKNYGNNNVQTQGLANLSKKVLLLMNINDTTI